MSTVAMIMSKQPKTVGPSVSIVSAAKKMKTARVGSLFVKKGNAAIRVAVDGKGWSMEEIKAREKALASALLAKL